MAEHRERVSSAQKRIDNDAPHSGPLGNPKRDEAERIEREHLQAENERMVEKLSKIVDIDSTKVLRPTGLRTSCNGTPGIFRASIGGQNVSLSDHINMTAMVAPSSIHYSPMASRAGSRAGSRANSRGPSRDPSRGPSRNPSPPSSRPTSRGRSRPPSRGPSRPSSPPAASDSRHASPAPNASGLPPLRGSGKSELLPPIHPSFSSPSRPGTAQGRKEPSTDSPLRRTSGTGVAGGEWTGQLVRPTAEDLNAAALEVEPRRPSNTGRLSRNVSFGGAEKFEDLPAAVTRSGGSTSGSISGSLVIPPSLINHEERKSKIRDAYGV